MMRTPIVSLCLLLASSASAAATEPTPAVSFNRDIRPILSEKCLACHGFDPKHREAGLRLDTFAGATADRDGVRAVVPGDLAKSELWARIESADPDVMMPPPSSHKPALTAAQRAALDREWANYFLLKGAAAERAGRRGDARGHYWAAIRKAPTRIRCYTRWLRALKP